VGSGYAGVRAAIHRIRQWLNRYYKPLEVEDSYAILLRKALSINGSIPKGSVRVQVTANNTQRIYSGSHYCILDGRFYLLGSFLIDTTKIEGNFPEKAKLTALGDIHGTLPQKKRTLIKALDLLAETITQGGIIDQEKENTILVVRQKVQNETDKKDEGPFKSWPGGNVERLDDVDEPPNTLMDLGI
jgi:hypothetical protein